ncbi:MAG: serine/threonine protein kinase [Polyangiaceae bacterium]|nr:serine/threonine protein kinase [Polyangiaceae bacterium]
MPAGPTRLGKFELLLPIGTGGMATVFLGRAPVIEGVYRDVAIKLMHAHLGVDGIDGPGMLLQEAEIAALVRHPNVVTVEEAAVDPAGVYLVMPYVEGDSLAGLVRSELTSGGVIPRRIIARILCDALAGLHAAHELADEDGQTRNVVHRDFTPSNILVGVDGVSRLSDFGVAKVTSRIARTATGQIKGKIGYMSPEQVRTDPLDRRTDVWAAGVIAWESLTGRRLYASDEVGTMLRIAQDTPPRLQSVMPDISDPLDTAVASALEPDLKQRCPTADELRKRLTAAFEAQGGGGIADPGEVGAYVRRLAGTSLADRRERAAAVLKARRGVHDPATPSEQGAAKSAERLDLAKAAPPESDTTAVDFSRSAGNRPSSGKSRTIAFGVAIVAGAVTGLVVYAFRDPPMTAPSAPGSGAAASAPASSAPETPVVTAVDASAKPITAVTLKADAPIASVTIGERTVVIAAPREEVAIELPPETPRPALLDVVSSNRRQVQVTVEAGASTVDVSFAGATARPVSGGNAARVPSGGARPTGGGAKKGSTKGPKLGDYPGK